MKPIKKNKAGLILLLIVGIFSFPAIFAWFFYKHPQDLHTGTSNHGYLITPAFQLTNLHVQLARAANFDPLKIQANHLAFDKGSAGKWLLFVLNPDNCHKKCQTALHEIRQIRLATNADQNRVITAVLSFRKPALNSDLNQLLATDYPGTYSLTTHVLQFKKVVERKVKHNYALLEGAIYIVDPLSNVILVYAPNTNPEFIYKDLHHLLQVSQIG